MDKIKILKGMLICVAIISLFVELFIFTQENELQPKDKYTSIYQENELQPKDKYTSIYYEDFPPGPPIIPDPKKTALLIVDMQNQFALPNFGDALEIKKRGVWEKWEYFYGRLDKIVIPNTQELLKFCRENNIEVSYAKIACFHKDGRDRSLVQSRPGWNDILLPKGSYGARIIDELKPLPDEIVVDKTTDSTLMGSNYERILRNMRIEYAIVTGIVTDQCISSTVRSLADAGFNVIVVEDCCAAGTPELHEVELKIINNIYCQVMSTEEIIKLLSDQLKV
jgi:nicotinamidase-related amidase